MKKTAPTTATKSAPEPAVILEVYDPTGRVEVTQVHAPRLDTLEGKTICELSSEQWGTWRTFPEIRKHLQELFPTATFIPYTEFPKGTAGIDSNNIADIVAEKGCDAVIIGNAA
ncbi:hypothetical protein ACFLUZ_05565 [Chloroflexota bacterium]